jgi:hypothetical protein
MIKLQKVLRTIKMKKIRYLFFSILMLGLLLSPGSRAYGTNSRDWDDLEVVFDETITLTPKDDERTIRSRTTLSINASISGVGLNTSTTFAPSDSPDPAVRQEFDLKYEIGELKSNSEGVFDSSINGLNYLLQQGSLEREYFSISPLLLLEYVESEDRYGSGFGFELDGPTDEGTNVSASFYFGMDSYLEEIHDPTAKGSGYYIINEEDTGLSEFPFGSALIEISDVGLGPCVVGNRTKFMRGEGFLFSGFSFDLIEDNGPLNSRAYVYFTDKENTVTLVPTFRIQGPDWDIIADFGGKFESEAAKLKKLEVRGIKFSSWLDENLKISGITALAGQMKKEKGAKQLYSRAEDYKLGRSFDEIAKKYLFEEVKWSDVFSLEYGSSNSDNRDESFFLDLYLKQEDKDGDFGLHTVNGLASFEVGANLTVKTGIKLSTGKGLEKILFNLVQNF